MKRKLVFSAVVLLLVSNLTLATEPKLKKDQKNNKGFELEHPATEPRTFFIKTKDGDELVGAGALYIGQTVILIPESKTYTKNELYVEFYPKK